MSNEEQKIIHETIDEQMKYISNEENPLEDRWKLYKCVINILPKKVLCYKDMDSILLYMKDLVCCSDDNFYCMDAMVDLTIERIKRDPVDEEGIAIGEFFGVPIQKIHDDMKRFAMTHLITHVNSGIREFLKNIRYRDITLPEPVKIVGEYICA
jgi:hypothetical protein